MKYLALIQLSYNLGTMLYLFLTRKKGEKISEAPVLQSHNNDTAGVVSSARNTVANRCGHVVPPGSYTK